MTKNTKNSSIILGVHFPKKIFVGCLPKHVTADDLCEAFSKYGKVVEAKVMMDRRGFSKRFGFVLFSSVQEVETVLSVEAVFVQGEQVNVGPAVRREESEDIDPAPVKLMHFKKSRNSRFNRKKSYHKGVYAFENESTESNVTEHESTSNPRKDTNHYVQNVPPPVYTSVNSGSYPIMQSHQQFPPASSPPLIPVFAVISNPHSVSPSANSRGSPMYNSIPSTSPDMFSTSSRPEFFPSPPHSPISPVTFAPYSPPISMINTPDMLPTRTPQPIFTYPPNGFPSPFFAQTFPLPMDQANMFF